jgi:hypothetical protein
MLLGQASRINQFQDAIYKEFSLSIKLEQSILLIKMTNIILF